MPRVDGRLWVDGLGWFNIVTQWYVPCPAPAAGHRAGRPSCPQGAFILVGPADKKQENPQMKTISRRGGKWGLVQPGFRVSLQDQWDSASSWDSWLALPGLLELGHMARS